jgi:hypothetical protein
MIRRRRIVTEHIVDAKCDRPPGLSPAGARGIGAPNRVSRSMNVDVVGAGGLRKPSTFVLMLKHLWGRLVNLRPIANRPVSAAQTPLRPGFPAQETSAKTPAKEI